MTNGVGGEAKLLTEIVIIIIVKVTAGKGM